MIMKLKSFHKSPNHPAMQSHLLDDMKPVLIKIGNLPDKRASSTGAFVHVFCTPAFGNRCCWDSCFTSDGFLLVTGSRKVRVHVYLSNSNRGRRGIVILGGSGGGGGVSGSCPCAGGSGAAAAAAIVWLARAGG